KKRSVKIFHLTNHFTFYGQKNPSGPKRKIFLQKRNLCSRIALMCLSSFQKKRLLADKRKEKLDVFNSMLTGSKEHSLFRKGDLYLSDSTGYFTIRDFDTLPGKSFKGEVSGHNIFMKIPANTLVKGKTYE